MQKGAWCKQDSAEAAGWPSTSPGAAGRVGWTMHRVSAAAFGMRCTVAGRGSGIQGADLTPNCGPCCRFTPGEAQLGRLLRLAFQDIEEAASRQTAFTLLRVRPHRV